MTAQLAPTPVFKAFDNNGIPLFSGKLFSYAAGTTTKQTTYVDSTQTTPNTNPIILNARGEANVWLNPALSYKFVLSPATDTDPPTSPIWTVDNVPGGYLTSSSVIPASSVSYTPPGTGAVTTTVQGKLTQYISVIDFGADNTGVADSTIAFTNAGAYGPEVWVPPGTYLLNSTPSMGTGVWSFANGVTLTGAGSGSVAISNPTTGQQFIAANGSANAYANLYVRRVANYTGQSSGGVATPGGIRVDTFVSSGVTNFEWSIIGCCFNSATGGQNVGIYGQAHKMTTNAGPTWAATFEAREVVATANPTSQLIGIEVDCLANGTDSNNERLGIDVVCSRSNLSGAANEVTYGVRVQNNGDGANSLVKTCFATVAYCNVGFDTTNATTVAAAYRMATNQNITFDGSGSGNNQLFYDGQGLKYNSGGNSSMRFNGSGSIQFGGSTLPIALQGTTAATATAGGGQATPATVLGYLNISVNGTNAKIPYYAV